MTSPPPDSREADWIALALGEMVGRRRRQPVTRVDGGEAGVILGYVTITDSAHHSLEAGFILEFTDSTPSPIHTPSEAGSIDATVEMADSETSVQSAQSALVYSPPKSKAKGTVG
jgi:hypothetical protein